MVDRVALLSGIAKVGMSVAEQEKVSDLLDKAIAVMLAKLPLTAARSLSAEQKTELATALHHHVTRSDVVKVAKNWEPKRKIHPHASHTDIANSLIELLNNERQPYAPITLPLEAARQLPEADRIALAHVLLFIAPPVDVKKLLKKWDSPKTALSTATAADQAKHLVKLLDIRPASEAARRAKPALLEPVH